MLYDKFKDEKINLRRNNKYSYTPERLGDEHMRFSILINPEDYKVDDEEDISTDIINESDENIVITKLDDKIMVVIPQHIVHNNGYITINDLAGKIVTKSKILSEIQYVNLPNEKGVYLIEVNIGGIQKIKKVL